MCTLEATIGSRQLDVDEIIDNFPQNKYHAAMKIDGLKEEPVGQLEDNPWEELLMDGSEKNDVKIVEINPYIN